MPRYTVEFRFQHATSAFRPDGDWIEGQSAITTDKEPETQEEFDEISKTLFRQIPDCGSLELLRVISSEQFVDDTHLGPLEGEIVID